MGRATVTELDPPLTICVQQQSVISDVLCLSFYNERTKEWECQDYQLQYHSDEALVCGVTDHLTEFALLLGAGGAGSSTQQFVLAWVSLGLVCGGVLVVAAGVGAVEIYYVQQRRRQS